MICNSQWLFWGVRGEVLIITMENLLWYISYRNNSSSNSMERKKLLIESETLIKKAYCKLTPSTDFIDEQLQPKEVK